MTPDPIMAFKSRRRFKKSSSSSSSSNRYLKPGALAQLRYNLSASRCWTDIGKKRVVLDSKDKKCCIEKKRIMLNSQERKVVVFPPPPPPDFDNNFNKSPTDPHHAVSQFKSYECHSRLESLPIELLVKILCFLHHDQLRAVFHVSQRIRSAVIVARQTYFNYTTPDRSRLEILCMQTPLPADHWPFARRGWEEGRRTPWAPRQGPRAQARLQGLDVKPISAVLFQEDSSDPRAFLPSNRVLFYEDDLCHAVSQNKLR